MKARNLIAGAACLVALACGKPVFPLLTTLEATIAADLEAGDSDEQMASDVCKDLGGTALTDAVCADATGIVVDIVTSLLDAKVLGPKAHARAMGYLASRARR